MIKEKNLPEGLSWQSVADDKGRCVEYICDVKNEKVYNDLQGYHSGRNNSARKEDLLFFCPSEQKKIVCGEKEIDIWVDFVNGLVYNSKDEQEGKFGYDEQRLPTGVQWYEIKRDSSQTIKILVDIRREKVYTDLDCWLHDNNRSSNNEWLYEFKLTPYKLDDFDGLKCFVDWGNGRVYNSEDERKKSVDETEQKKADVKPPVQETESERKNVRPKKKYARRFLRTKDYILDLSNVKGLRAKDSYLFATVYEPRSAGDFSGHYSVTTTSYTLGYYNGNEEAKDAMAYVLSCMCDEEIQIVEVPTPLTRQEYPDRKWENERRRNELDWLPDNRRYFVKWGSRL